MPDAKINGSNGRSPAAEPTMDKRMMIVVFVALVVDLLAFTMILPLLPALLDYYGLHDKVLF